MYETRQTSGGEAGWSIGELYYRSRTDEQDAWTQHTGVIRFQINGSAISTENQPGEIRAYWIRDDPENESDGNLRVNCASTEPFRAYWERPKTADEWEADVTPDPRYGASNVSFTMSNTGERWPELTGTVDIQQGKFSTVSIRVRGRFGDDGWGAWSPVTELFCNPPGGL